MAGHDIRTDAAEPVFDAFSGMSQSLHWEALPERTRTNLRRELLDYFGAAVAGRKAAGMPAWLQVLIDMGGRPDARVVGGPGVPAPLAALCNGYFGHVLEFDDTHDEAVLHAGAAVIPAALAAAGLRGAVSGREFCEAVLLGIELTCRLGVATRLNLVEGGWIYTALLGHFGATLAAARLLDADPKVWRNALGIVYCLASGNHQSTREGAPTKHVQPGFAASNAVTAAMMAARGLQGVGQPLSGEDGLARVYLRGQFDAARALRDLGVAWEADRLSIKPYPTCRLTHPAISATLELRERLGDRLTQVERVELLMGEQACDVVGRGAPEKRVPQTRINAQFSAHWSAASALAYGEVTPLQLASDIPPSAALAAWIARVECRAVPSGDARDVGGCKVRAIGPFGTVEVEHKSAKGHPDHPVTDDELLAKFLANLSYAGVADGRARELADAILTIDRLPDVRVLADALAGAAV